MRDRGSLELVELESRGRRYLAVRDGRRWVCLCAWIDGTWLSLPMKQRELGRYVALMDRQLGRPSEERAWDGIVDH